VTGQGRSAINSGFTFLTIAVPNMARRIGIQTELEAAFGTILANTRLHIFTQIQGAQGQRSAAATIFKDVESD